MAIGRDARRQCAKLGHVERGESKMRARHSAAVAPVGKIELLAGPSNMIVVLGFHSCGLILDRANLPALIGADIDLAQGMSDGSCKVGEWMSR
jgi:hypothetical protein